MLRSVQWGSTGNLAHAGVPSERLARFSALYHGLWQLAVAMGVGAASAMMAVLSGGRPATTGDSHTAFLVEASITLGALFAYRGLTPRDGDCVIGKDDAAVLAKRRLGRRRP